MSKRARQIKGQELIDAGVAMVGDNFDGNMTRWCTGFIFPGMAWSGLDEEVMDQLLNRTMRGDLAWCLFLTKKP